MPRFLCAADFGSDRITVPTIGDESNYDELEFSDTRGVKKVRRTATGSLDLTYDDVELLIPAGFVG